MQQIDKGEKTKTIEIWIDLYGDHLFSWALFKTSSRETSEDLLQETFLSAYQSLDNFQNKSQPKTWLFSILKNKIIDHYRKSINSITHIDTQSEKDSIKLTDSMFDNNQNWKPSGFETIWADDRHLLDDPEFIAILDSCMDDLPDSWRFAITAKYHMEKKATEICKELDVSASNYWQIIHRSKLLLKKCIENQWVL